MHKLILDQYTQQSLFKRFLGNTLTGLGWIFWAYLWLPLIAAIILLLGPNPEQASSAASRSIIELLSTLSSHILVVALMVLAFLSWALLQWLGKSSRREALKKRQVQGFLPGALGVYEEHEIKSWRQAQCMVVSHDDAYGLIEQVNILQSNSRVVSPISVPAIRPSLSIRKHPIVCSAINVYP